MAKNTIPRGETSVIRHVFIQDSTSTTGTGKTALAYNTASLTAYYIYPGGTATALTLETISTLGTYAAPTSAAHMRFKLVDDTNMPGIYEVQFHNDWFSVANARKGGVVQMKGATGMAPLEFEFDVIGFELQSATPTVNPGTGTGLTAVPWNSAWDAEVESEVTDALTATVADSVPADGVRPSIAQAAYMVVQFLMERSISGTTMLVKKVDGSTTLLTVTLDDADAPTSYSRTG